MNPAPPPNDDGTSYTWIGNDAHQAGVYGMIVPLVTYDNNGRPVFWFQKKTTSRRHLNLSLVTDLLSIGRVYLVRYQDGDTPIKLVNMAKPNRSYDVDQESLRAFMANRGQPR